MAVVFLYNAEIKEQFLATLVETSRNNLRWRFIQIANALETPLRKDVLEATLSELREGFSAFCFTDVQSSRTALSWFRAYNRWAHETSQPFAFTDALEVFDERVDVDYTAGIRSSILPAPEVLVEKVTRMYAIDEGYEVLPALILAWLGFSSPAEALKVRNTDLDFTHHQLFLPDGSVYPYDIPEVFWEPLEVYANTEEAVRYKLNAQRVTPVNYGFFIKKFKTENATAGIGLYTAASLSKRIGDLLDKASQAFHDDTVINFTTVFKSGVFYRLYQYELSGADLYAKENKDKVLSIANKKSFKDVMTVYEAYRAVFYPRS